MVGSVKLHGGESWVTWWSVGLYQCGIGLHGGVLGYMVESAVLHGMLDYIEGSVGLNGVLLLGSGCLILPGGGGQKILVNDPETITASLCGHEQMQPPHLSM